MDEDLRKDEWLNLLLHEKAFGWQKCLVKTVVWLLNSWRCQETVPNTESSLLGWWFKSKQRRPDLATDMLQISQEWRLSVISSPFWQISECLGNDKGIPELRNAIRHFVKTVTICQTEMWETKLEGTAKSVSHSNSFSINLRSTKNIGEVTI